MNANQNDTGKFDVTTIIAIIGTFGTIFGISFGAFQYCDKREIKKELDILSAEEKGLIIRATELRNQAEISIHYIGTNFIAINEHMARGDDFDTALLKWSSQLEAKLPYKAKITPVKNIVYEEIKKGAERIKSIEDCESFRMTFFLIKNAGATKATNISLAFQNVVSTEIYPVKLDQLESHEGVMFPIMSVGMSNFIMLEPLKYLEYFDNFLNKTITLPVRPKLESARIIDPSTVLHSYIKKIPDIN